MTAAKRTSISMTVIHPMNPDSLRGDTPLVSTTIAGDDASSVSIVVEDIASSVCTGMTTVGGSDDAPSVCNGVTTVVGDVGKILGGAGSPWSITWIACPRFKWEAHCNYWK